MFIDRSLIFHVGNRTGRGDTFPRKSDSTFGGFRTLYSARVAGTPYDVVKYRGRVVFTMTNTYFVVPARHLKNKKRIRMVRSSSPILLEPRQFEESTFTEIFFFHIFIFVFESLFSSPEKTRWALYERSHSRLL